MKASNRDFRTYKPGDIEKKLAEYAHGQMHDEHTIALIVRLKRDRPAGFISRNRRLITLHNPPRN